MVLPDWMIEKLAFITPMAPGEQRPGVISYGLTSYGYDARIGPKNLKVFSGINAREIDPKAFDPFLLVEPKIYKDKGEYFYVPPHGFALCETVEEFDIPREYVCIVLGKSTYARTGLIVNVTPGEPEWKGIWTVELSNTTELPIRVYLNEGIMQCMFFKGERVCRTSYKDKKGKYQDQSGVTLPKVINLDSKTNNLDPADILINFKKLNEKPIDAAIETVKKAAKEHEENYEKTKELLKEKWKASPPPSGYEIVVETEENWIAKTYKSYKERLEVINAIVIDDKMSIKDKVFSIKSIAKDWK